MSYLDWKVGDRVVCIDDEWNSIRHFGREVASRVPMINEVLTIASIEAGFGQYGTGREDGVFLEFAEIPLTQGYALFSADFRWDAASFRPLVSRKTDISVFTALLHTTRVPSKTKETT